MSQASFELGFLSIKKLALTSSTCIDFFSSSISMGNKFVSLVKKNPIDLLLQQLLLIIPVTDKAYNKIRLSFNCSFGGVDTFFL